MAFVLSWPVVTLIAVVAAYQGALSDDGIGPVMLGYSLAACVLSAVAATRSRLDRRTASAWWIMAVGHGLGVVACVLFAGFDSFPGPGDYVRLSMAPVLLAGVLRLTIARRSARERQRLALDISVVVSGSFMLLWYVTLGPSVVADDIPTPVVLVAVAYPLADLVLVFGAATALLRSAVTGISRPLLLLVVGLVAFVAADVTRSRRALATWPAGAESLHPASALEWIGLLGAVYFMALAAAEQCRSSAVGEGVEPRDDVRPITLLPYAAVCLAYALLVIAAFRNPLYPWRGLVLGGSVMTACVVARQILVLRENHALVVSDDLTGLATRPRLHTALERALVVARRAGTPTAVLVIDLDGFKQVNDSFGHEAGDALLVGVADRLVEAVSRSDTVGRLGGDEFAVVLPAVGSLENAQAVVQRMIAALETPMSVAGQRLVARASIGIAMSAPEASVADMLRRADRAMYEAKRTGAGNSTYAYDRLNGDASPVVVRQRAPESQPTSAPPSGS